MGLGEFLSAYFGIRRVCVSLFWTSWDCGQRMLNLAKCVSAYFRYRMCFTTYYFGSRNICLICVGPRNVFVTSFWISQAFSQLILGLAELFMGKNSEIDEFCDSEKITRLIFAGG